MRLYPVKILGTLNIKSRLSNPVFDFLIVIFLSFVVYGIF
jgi:hypothetical protein